MPSWTTGAASSTDRRGFNGPSHFTFDVDGDRGPDAIRGWSDREFIGVDVSLEVTAVEQSDGATTVTATVGGRGFNGPSHFTFDVDGDRVARMQIRA